MIQVGFIGGGQMAAAIIGGLRREIEAGRIDVSVADPNVARCQYLQRTYPITIAADNKGVMAAADIVFIAVKPQLFHMVEEEIASAYRQGQLLLSIMAGIPIDTVSRRLPSCGKVMRLMPNLAMAIGEGVCLLSAGAAVTEEEKAKVVDLLSVSGLVQEMEEHYINGAMSISGSGPAFFYTMIESLMLGGVAVGLPKEMALSLATQTMLGTAHLLKETGEHPAALRDAILSAGGATIAGLAQLEAGGFRSDLMRAVEAATARAETLGAPKGGQRR